MTKLLQLGVYLSKNLVLSNELIKDELTFRALALRQSE